MSYSHKISSLVLKLCGERECNVMAVGLIIEMEIGTNPTIFNFLLTNSSLDILLFKSGGCACNHFRIVTNITENQNLILTVLEIYVF